MFSIDSRTMASIRIAIQSDSKLFRDGLRRILESDPSFDVVGEYEDARTNSTLFESSPHILLADGRMDGGASVHRDTRSRPWVIVLAAESDDDWAVSALISGARGVLQKDAGPEDLRKAILVVNAGEIWARKEVVAKIVETITGLADPADEERARMIGFLSPREREIAAEAANGFSNKEIAAHIAVSEATVKAHLTKIFQKLKVRDRAQLAALYHRSFSGRARQTSRSLRESKIVDESERRAYPKV
jgi:DNA-binding NarL/FixJ family response regulator